MIITKQQFLKLFENYTTAIYNECGRSLSARQKRILHNKCESIYKEHTLKGYIKKVFHIKLKK